MQSDFDHTRQEREAIFHDEWARSIDIDAVKVKEIFESPTAVENKFILSLLGDIEGKTILDLGCGMGDATVFFATQGAFLHAIDISSGMIEITQRLARKHRVQDRVYTQRAAAESLKFDDNFFDFVYGNGILHHVDFMQVRREVHRVLKPNGIAAFIEPLSYNPIIWVYRAMASSARTQDEHPLSAKDIRQFCNGRSGIINTPQWSEAEHREYHLSTLLIMVWFLLGEHILPSKERYWKRFRERGQQYRSAFEFFYRVDQFLYRHLPLSRWLSWNTVIVLKK